MKRTFLRNSFCRHLTCSTGRFTYLSTCLSADLPEALSARVSSARKKGYRRGRGVVDAVPVEGLSRLCSYRLVIKSRGTGQKLGWNGGRRCPRTVVLAGRPFTGAFLIKRVNVRLASRRSIYARAREEEPRWSSSVRAMDHGNTYGTGRGFCPEAGTSR